MSQRTIQELLERCELLCHVIAVEPDVLCVLEQATVRSAYRTRWAAYSALKEACRCLVGWHARHVQLCEPHYHEAVMAALDVLLPPGETGGKYTCAQARYSSEEEEEGED